MVGGKTISTFILCAATLSAFAQDSVLLKFLDYRKNVFVEKIFVHTDRDAYLTGETMWFKIYNVDGSFHSPAEISKVAYVEIVDNNNQSLVKEKIELTNGIGSGTLFIPATIPTGNYLLRVYTNWMKNFSSDYFFHKQVTVINSFVKPETKAASPVTSDVQFFPEGGHLLAGPVNKIAFKGVGRNGNGISFRGAVIDENNDTLVRFKPLRFGMGSFELTPVPSKKYKAVIYIDGSPASVINLPDVEAEGYSIRTIDGGGSLTVEVSRRPATENNSISILVHTRMQVVESEKAMLTNGKATFTIPKSDLKSGISHITIFDDHSNPVAERLYFRRPEDVIQMSLKSNFPSYPTRSKTTLDLQTDRAVSQMSVSVYRIDSLNADQSEHINEAIYLTSDLRGRIESPDFYFTSGPDAEAAADNLMLTQGWRKFTWADVMKARMTFDHVPEVHGHIINGLVTDLDGNPTRSAVSYISVPGKIIDIYSSRSNSKGEVLFEMKHFVGTSNVTTFVDSLHQIRLSDPFSAEKTNAHLSELKLSPSGSKNLLERAVGMQVQNIYFTEKFQAPKIDSSSFYGKADETYYLDDYTRFPVMEEVMREYVRGVFVRKQKGHFKFYLLDQVRDDQLKDTPLILIDGIPVFDVDRVMAYNPLHVKKIEVMTRRVYHGNSTFFGVVSLSTYKGDLEGFDPGTQYKKMEYQGLQLQREFYAPRHEFESNSELRLPDQRSLLHWDPSLSTDHSGKQTIQFFTSDVPGSYLVVVEGITVNGACGHATYTFNVTK